ncbi:MAG: radical SAM protein [Desulfobacteraceae bacterium]|nr:radical SAM protein [Desulfobacteraceae bacterium]
MKKNTSQIQYIDTTRDALLASIYTHDYKRFEHTFSNLVKEIRLNPALLENTLKSLYQIASIIKKFKKELKKNLKNNIVYSDFNKLLKTCARHEIKNQTRIDYKIWKSNLGIDDATLKILFSTTINFQLTTGCNNYCKRCNEWAVPGVRKYFSYDAIIEIAEDLYKERNKEYALYCASDPLDWQDNNKDITHLIAALSKKNFTSGFGLLTKIPKGKEAIFKKLIQAETDISASVTSLNSERIKKIESQLKKTIHKQHETDDLLIPAGRDEDFCTIKSSITDSYGTEITPDGAFIVAPTFTSALNPTGQKRTPINRDTKFFIQKMAGTKGLEFDYFKNLKVIDRENKRYTLGHLLDSQIENLVLDSGDYETTQPGMISLKEYFDTFKPEAVNKRKAMLPSIKKRLKDEYLDDEYKIKLKEFENLCDQTYETKLKQKTLISFLSSIKQYLKKNNDKRIIISHLRKNEITDAKKVLTKITALSQIKTILQEPDSETFHLFNYLVFTLLDNPDNTLLTNLLG